MLVDGASFLAVGEAATRDMLSITCSRVECITLWLLTPTGTPNWPPVCKHIATSINACDMSSDRDLATAVMISIPFKRRAGACIVSCHRHMQVVCSMRYCMSAC